MCAEAFNSLDEVFLKFLQNKDMIFKNREILNHNYVPTKLFHREQQYNLIFQALLAGYKIGSSFILCYGDAGTGKSSLIMSLLNKISKKCEEIGCKDIITSLINCRLTTTNYRILVNLIGQIGLSIPSRCNFNKLFQRFKKEIGSKNQLIVIVLDEIDKIFGNSSKKANNISDFLINISEQLNKTKICIIGISKDLNFKNNLSAKFLSELNVQMCEFYPYNANELRNILIERIILGFCPGVVSENVLNLIADLSAESGGDARYALCLLQKAGELAERKSEKNVTEEHVKSVHKILKNGNSKYNGYCKIN
ncbi:MAG: Cdc6/Cdc18 family protein [Promethearchaeota archaeon]